jgi:hypothetical protein
MRDMWGAPMWNLSGLVLVLGAVENWENVRLPWICAGALALFGIGLGGFVLANVIVPQREIRPSRIQWPDRALAQTFEAVWWHQFHSPLRIVAADGWLGGLVAMRSVPRPSVWIDADYRKAPWINPDMVKHYGALALWRIRPGQNEPSAFAALKGTTKPGRKSFVWPDVPKAAPLEIGYAILPPVRR